MLPMAHNLNFEISLAACQDIKRASSGKAGGHRGESLRKADTRKVYHAVRPVAEYKVAAVFSLAYDD